MAKADLISSEDLAFLEHEASLMRTSMIPYSVLTTGCLLQKLVISYKSLLSAQNTPGAERLRAVLSEYDLTPAVIEEIISETREPPDRL